MVKLLGVVLKRIRKEKRITLKELAVKCGVSASFLSQVENGKTIPSLATLKNIADNLNTTVGALIGEPPEKDLKPVLRKKDRKFLKRIDTDISICTLTSSDPYKLMEPLYNKLEKNAVSGQSTYRHYGQEFGYILRGKLEITLNNEKYILKEGDTIYFNSSTPHSFRNIYDGETEMLWVVTPPSF